MDQIWTKLRQTTLQDYKNQGYEIIQLDEVLFSPDSYVSLHWAPAGDPIRRTSRFLNKDRVVVMGAISPTRGNIYYHYGIRSFNQDDMIEMLR